ncbi:MAG: UDP-N-acetylmuramoyl-L-alanine--D-glutamate ligase [Deltaproteobacteria bacterium]
MGFINIKYEQFKDYIKGKNTAVIGIGVSNTPLAKFLLKLGAKVTAFDKNSKEQLGDFYKELKDLDVNFCLGEDYLKNLKGFDVIFKTPVIRYDLPELIEAQKQGAVITSEMEVFLDICPSRIFGVTGSDGKTTTTTLIYKILSQEGYKCWLGGNIGTPLLDKIEEISPTDMVVLELSSFQLHTSKISPQTAVITNLAPNHLDIHKSMEEYIDAKKNIYLYQKTGDRLVLNFDNEITREMANEAKGEVVLFSRFSEIEGVCMSKDSIVINKNGKVTQIMGINEILIPGIHNVENYLTAIAAIYDIVSAESIRAVAKTFAGVAHRIELVREYKGVKYYNDSIASSPTRTIAGLNAFKQKVILIAGGYDKKIPYDTMGAAIIDKVKRLILIGQTGHKIKQAYLDECKNRNIQPKIPVLEGSTLEEAVKIAYNESIEGDIVILSPASASFDMFRNFEERGIIFKEVVSLL